MFDLDAYLARVGLSGTPSLGEVHRAHVTSIPFENLDSHRGAPVSLAAEDLASKLVGARRGGYCFEQNLLLKAALEALGAEVDLLLARVRVGAPPGAVRPRTHLVLRVREGGEVWHADVGFGSGCMLDPLPFGAREEFEQEGWRFRVRDEADDLVLQTLADGEWADVYAFSPHAVPFIDLETSNWFTSTHPRSPFVTGLIVVSQTPDGIRTVLSDWRELSLAEHRPDGTVVRPVEWGEVPELLASRFGLPGFELGAGGRIVPALSR
jgi:N-hydroxyarylamine O-acetyltransferase